MGLNEPYRSAEWQGHRVRVALACYANLGLAWEHDYGGDRMLTLRAHTAWTWVHSFDESDPVIRFRETAGTWSIRGDYVTPIGMAVAGRTLYYSANAGYG